MCVCSILFQMNRQGLFYSGNQGFIFLFSLSLIFNKTVDLNAYTTDIKPLKRSNLLFVKLLYKKSKYCNYLTLIADYKISC